MTSFGSNVNNLASKKRNKDEEELLKKLNIKPGDNSISALMGAQRQNPNIYNNSYASAIKSIYDKIANRQQFTYNPANDAAYQQAASEYRALSGLTAGQTQGAIDGLTGGYDSSYTSAVSGQMQNDFNKSAENLQSEYYLQAQDKHNQESQSLLDLYSTVSQARDSEMDAWSQLHTADNAYRDDIVNQYANQSERKRTENNDAREYDLQQYSNDNNSLNNKRNIELKNNEISVGLAQQKCVDYNEKKDNKGMKSYLKNQVSKGNISQYQADNLYEQYQYVAAKSSSTGGRSTGSTSKTASAKAVLAKGAVDNSKVAAKESAMGKGFVVTRTAYNSDKNLQKSYKSYEDYVTKVYGAAINQSLGSKYTNEQLNKWLDNQYKSGTISDKVAEFVYKKYHKKTSNVFSQTRNAVTHENDK